MPVTSSHNRKKKKKADDLKVYQSFVQKKLSRIAPYLQRAALGDFSRRLPLPKTEDDFTELEVSINLMLEDLKEIKKELEQANKQCEQKVIQNTKELLASQERYKGLLDSQSDMIVRIDANNKLTFVNDAYCKKFGKTKKQLYGKSFAPLVHKDDIGDTLKTMKKLYKPPYRVTILQRAKTIDGWRWIEWEDSIVRDEKGKIVEIQGVGKDVHDKKIAEEHAQEMVDVVNNIDIGFHVYHLEHVNDDRTLRMILINNAAEKIVGVPSKDLIGNTLDENFPGLRKQGIPQLYARVVRTGKSVYLGDIEYGDTRVQKKWFRVNAFPLPKHRVGVSFEDVTIQKKADQRLKESEERFRQLFDNIGSGVAVYEVKHNGSKFYFKDFNNAAEKIEHKKKKDVVGKEVRDVFPGAEEMGFVDLLQHVYQTGKTEYFPVGEYKNEKTGTTYYRENYIYRLGHDSIVAVFNDITERMTIQKQLKENERKYRILFDASLDALTILDKQGKFIAGNKSAIELFGVKNEKEFLTYSPWKLSPETQEHGENSKDMAQKMIGACLKEGSRFFEWIHKTKQGKTFFADVLLTRIVINNEELILATIRDISERKEFTSKLQEKVDELEQINKLMVGRELKMIELKKQLDSLKHNT